MISNTQTAINAKKYVIDEVSSLAKSLAINAQEAFWDTLYIDVPTDFVVYGAMSILTGGAFFVPFAFKIGAAFAGNIVKEVCNTHQLLDSEGCGIAKNVVKYSLKGIPDFWENSLNVALLNRAIDVEVGINNAIQYADKKDVIAKQIEDKDTEGLFEEIESIELMDTIACVKKLPTAGLQNVLEGCIDDLFANGIAATQLTDTIAYYEGIT